MAIIFAIPFVYLVYFSLTSLEYSGPATDPVWLGFRNYRELISDERFLLSVLRSINFGLLCAVPVTASAFLISEALALSSSGRAWFIVIFLIPGIMPPIVVALLWKILLQGEYGIVSYILTIVSIPGSNAILSQGTLVLFLVLAAIEVWQWAPVYGVLIYAARSLLPSNVQEAATLDGAGRIELMRGTTFPLLAPIVVLLFIIRFIEAFNIFDKAYLLTGGGPGTATEYTSLYTWRVAFTEWDFGYAAAMSLGTLIVISAFVTAIIFTWMKWFQGSRPIV